MTSAKNFFTAQQTDDIKQAIMDAELNTSGEVRVHIENECTGEVMDRALVLFRKLNMHKTDLGNGVLFYLAVQNRKFAIIGDKGIHAKVGVDFWEQIKLEMLQNFREDKFTEGLCIGIRMAGEQLKKHFPYQKNDVNELSDEISFDTKE